MQMETEAPVSASIGQRPTGVPRPRPFPILDNPPGPRCGHTLTTISGPEGDVNRAKLILFGAHAFIFLPAPELPASESCSGLQVSSTSDQTWFPPGLQVVQQRWRAQQRRTQMVHPPVLQGLQQVGCTCMATAVDPATVSTLSIQNCHIMLSCCVMLQASAWQGLPTMCTSLTSAQALGPR